MVTPEGHPKACITMGGMLHVLQVEEAGKTEVISAFSSEGEISRIPVPLLDRRGAEHPARTYLHVPHPSTPHQDSSLPFPSCPAPKLPPATCNPPPAPW